jgi:hypothetical protein
MRDRDIDDILRHAAGAPPAVDPALLDRISGSIGSSLRPVAPLPPAWAQAFGLFLISADVAIAGAGFLGFYGIRKLSAAEIALIFPVLGLLTWVAAMSSVGEMTPGSARRVPAVWLPAIGCLALIAVFGALFHDYHVDRFVPQGLVCLTAGLLHAVPAGIASWWLLRRGFAVNPVHAGLVTGTLASLAGVTMLELHCANFQAWHILLWHTAVVPLSGLAGALVTWVLARTRHSRQSR